MQNKRYNILLTILLALLVFGTSILCILKPAPAFSESERRELASLPKFSLEAAGSGIYAADFETYATERFPYRDTFRSIKAWVSRKIFGKLDDNGLFVADGHISKIESEANPAMMAHAAKRFSFLYETYFAKQGFPVYFSIVPDKNFLLAEKNGYPSLDYENFIASMRQMTDYMTYIDVTDLLDASDYYKTDTHWRQEEILDIAEKIGVSMGADVQAKYEKKTLQKPFYGVYKGQYAMDFPPDEIVYLENEILKDARVTYYDTGTPREGTLYDMEKAFGKDPYEMFLSGTMPLVTIENTHTKTDRELVLFRDSFGSSIAPLFLEGYKKITVVDIRYIQSAFLGNLVSFQNCDVLFLYSTTLLNNSMAMK